MIMKRDEWASYISNYISCCQGSACSSEIPLPFPCIGAPGRTCASLLVVALRHLEPFAWAHKTQKNLGIYISPKQPLTNEWQVQRYKYPCSLTPDQENCGELHCLESSPEGLSQLSPPHHHCASCLVLHHCLVCFLSRSTSPLPHWLSFGRLPDTPYLGNPHLKVCF